MQAKIPHEIATMSLLNRLLRTTKRDPSPETTIAALGGKDGAELYALIVSSSDAKVREEAVTNMSMGEELLNLAMGDASAKIKLLARRQVGVVLENDPSLIDGLISSLADKPLELINLVSCSSKAIDKTFANISDEQVLLDISLNGMTSGIRQHAAENIHSRAGLEQLLNSAKNKDKSVTQIIKAKLETFKKAEAALAEQQQIAQSLCASMETLRKRKLDDYFVQRFEELKGKWDALSDEEQGESKQRFRAAIDSCQQLLDLEKQQKQAEQAQQAANAQAREAIAAVQHKLTTLLAEIYSAERVDSEALKGQLADYAAQVKQLQQAQPSLTQQCNACFALETAADKLMLDIVALGSLPQLLELLAEADEQEGKEISGKINKLLRHKTHFNGELPATVAAAVKAVKGWSQAKKEKVEEERKLEKNIRELQRKANWAIDNGRLRQARGIYRELSEKRELHTHLPAGLVRLLEDLDEAMIKLGDWYEFAVQPKKQALVEKMEALAGSDIHPNDLSDRIKALQEEWRELSKGGKSQDEELWQRFQSAADKAFEPCRGYFDTQAKEREQNALKREELISQLQGYYESYSWESLVWKDVDQIINTAVVSWKGFWPVPRKDIKGLQKKFDEIMGNILSKLDEARAINHEGKVSLIKQAEALLEGADTTNNVEEAKRLQSSWKALGGSGARGRTEDQKLWQQFRAACDEIFERRQQENNAVQEKFNNEREKANNLLQKLDSILAQSGQEFLEAKKSVAEVRQEFLDVGELPDKEKHRMQSELNKKIDLIEAKTKTVRQSQLENSWSNVYQVANELRAYEEAVLCQSTTQEALDELKANIEETPSWPAGTQRLIEQRLNNAENQNIEASESEKTLRLLCIRNEISQGKESPAEDKALRMEYQVAQLQQGFGNNKANAKEAREELVLEWLAVPGLDEQAYEKLLQRFTQG
ncbi:protein of unknown function [Alteromonadaceae bacterium Bs31]|nr:protein of unknown function [Alteromonadaceae bacterium Bs31]